MRRATTAARRIARMVAPNAGLVLVYHRVAKPPIDPWDLAVSPEHFTEHLEVLREAFEPVDLGALGTVPRRRSRRRIAVTFDDGYRDNLLAAAPALEHAGIPATFFVVTGRIHQFWWDRLVSIVFADREGGGEAAGGTDSEDPPPSGEALEQRHVALWTELRTLRHEQREARIASLEQAAGRPRSLDPTAVRMHDDEIAALSASPAATIGAHTVTHPVLATLAPAEQLEEISSSVRTLADVTGRPVTRLAFPFGGDADVGPHAPRLARQCGLAVACTTRAAAVSPRDDPIQMPRLTVRDCDGNTLEAWLRHWTAS